MTLDSSTRFDIAIVGGGINGASAAQHLTAAGYRVFLAEQDDFANGASSRSSRLLHCGLRHLASGAHPADILRRPLRLARSLKTVREDMVARDEIVRSIPTRIKPMTFCLPIYKQDTYQPWHMDAAFVALRLTSPRGIPLDYRRYKPNSSDLPLLTRHLRDLEQLSGLVSFREYIFDWPERIAFDALADAKRMGAVLRNYAPVKGMHRENEFWHLTMQDESQVSASMVLNLAGAWVDTVSASAGSNASTKCQPISGVHIAIMLPAEFDGHGVFAFNRLGEPLYCLPWRGYHNVGLTRRPHCGNPSGIHASDEEIDWVLAETNHCFPDLRLTRKDVLYSWAGVNPLTADPAAPLGSREIKVHDLAGDGLPGMLTLTGGPIMTHRRVARRLLEQVRAHLKPSRAAQTSAYTGPQFTSSEAIRAATQETPRSLADLMMRRLGYGWDQDQGLSRLRHVAETAAPLMGWDSQRIELEIENYIKHLEDARRRPSAVALKQEDSR